MYPDIITRWNNGQIKILLAHPAVLWHGLNTTYGGSIIVWFRSKLVRRLYQQFNERLHRQGQTKPESVRIVADGLYRLIKRQRAIENRKNTNARRIVKCL